MNKGFQWNDAYLNFDQNGIWKLNKWKTKPFFPVEQVHSFKNKTISENSVWNSFDQMIILQLENRKVSRGYLSNDETQTRCHRVADGQVVIGYWVFLSNRKSMAAEEFHVSREKSAYSSAVSVKSSITNPFEQNRTKNGFATLVDASVYSILNTDVF